MQIKDRPLTLGQNIRELINKYIKFNNVWFIRKLYQLTSAIPFVIKCYSQILWLPKIIKGYQYKLSAQKEWHEHYKKIAKHKTQQVEDIMENTVADLVPAEDMKSYYERWDLKVPTEYLTDDEAWDILEKEHEDWLGSGGIGDLDHIYWNEQQGNKLLGGFDDKR